MWGISDLLGEPKEHKPMSLIEARSVVIRRAYEIEATQLALSEMDSKDKSNLRSRDSKIRDEAQEKFSQLRSDYYRKGNFEIETQSFAKARNEVWRKNKNRLNMERGEFIEWVGDDDVLLKGAIGDNLGDDS